MIFEVPFLQKYNLFYSQILTVHDSTVSMLEFPDPGAYKG